MSIGERITSLRKERNLSQGDLAKLLSVSRQAVSKWENDQSNPDTLKLLQLADVLDSEVEYLATGKRQELSPPLTIVSSEVPAERIVEVPKIVEVEKLIEVEKIVEKPIEVVKFVEKPVIRKVVRTKLIHNPVEYIALGVACFVLGLIVGTLL